MTSNIARLSALVCALLTLLCVAAWLLNGAPNVPHIDLLIESEAGAYWSNGELTLARYMIWGMGAASPWVAHAALYLLAASVTAAALLCLLTLLRGTPSISIRQLGVGLGWWSFSLGYLWLFSVVTTFEAFQRTPLVLRLTCDAIAFELLLASTYAFVLFWRGYPRPVGDEELRSFMDSLTRERYAFMGPFRKRLYKLLKGGRAVSRPEDATGARRAGTTPKASWFRGVQDTATFSIVISLALVVLTVLTATADRTWGNLPGLGYLLVLLWLIMFSGFASVLPSSDESRVADKASATARRIRTASVLLMVLWVSVWWRLWGLVPETGLWGSSLLTAIFGFFLLLCGPGLQCARLFRFHRALGSQEDRRKIEWIGAALWIALLLFLLPAAVTPLLYLAERWYPHLEFEQGWTGVYLLLSWMSGPLILIFALALSIFYRGTVDPRLALRGVTVWTLLGIVLTLIFVFVERSVAQRAVAWMALPPQTSLVTAGAIVAATFQPIRKMTEKYVNRFVERVLPETMLASGTRKLAAVAVVDISGYTRMSAEDEQGALVASAVVQKEAKRLADIHGGRVIKSTGDGVILSFPDAAQGLAAVQALHASVSARAKALEIGALRLHSGLHWGEVVEMHDGDIYGQAVNLTARIADWAQAGEIGMSEALAEQLATRPAGFESMGPQSFKNVPQPVTCLKLAPQ